MTKNSAIKATASVSMLLAALSWIYFCWPALASLHQRWVRWDEPYAIGYPTVALSLWWLYERRDRLRQVNLAPAHSVWLALIPTIAISIAAGLIYLQVVQQLATPLILWLMVAAMLGWATARVLVAPIALLFFAIPFVDIGNPLRTMTVWFSQHMLDLLHIPALVEGYQITLPAGTIEVANSCSGFNFLLAALFIALVLAESGRQKISQQVAIVLLGAGLGLIGNWIRVLSLVIIAHYSDMQNDLVRHHGHYGWGIFTVGLPPYFWLVGRIQGRVPSAAMPPRTLSQRETAQRAWSQIAVASVMVAAIITLSSMAISLLEHRRGTANAGFAGLPGAASIVPSWLPGYRGQDVTQSWKISAAGHIFELTTLTYIEQRADKKLIFYDNVIGAENTLIKQEQISVSSGFSANTVIIKHQPTRAVWWYWRVDGRTSASALKTKLQQLRALLFGDPSAALVVLSTPCWHEDCAQLMKELTPAAKSILFESSQMPPIRQPQGI